MTDQLRFPTRVRISVNGVVTGVYDLPDDPADHRGILSWYAQPQNSRLSEAGSYGYLVRSPVPLQVLQNSESKLTIRFEVDESLAGGLAVYGERFGSYPVEPSLVFTIE
jgi:predicted transcriptional regulator